MAWIQWIEVVSVNIGIIVLGLSFNYLIRKLIKPAMCKSKARLDGKVIIVTGSNAGIGKETVKDFVTRGAKVYMACRSKDRARAAAQDIRKQTGARPHRLVVMTLDLSSLRSVRQFAKNFKSRERVLDILVNNAGVIMQRTRTVSEDGFEMTLATNHLGHFLLTVLLLDRLLVSRAARVVTVSTIAHFYSSGIHFDDINLTGKSSKYGLLKAYAQSKLANIMFTRVLGERLRDTNVTTYCLHPGIIHTTLYRWIPLSGTALVRWLAPMLFFTKTVEEGAQTSIYCAVDEGIADETGNYYSDCSEAWMSSQALDDKACSRLWYLSIKMVNLSSDEMPEMLWGKKKEV